MPDWIGTILAALAGGGVAAIGTWILNWRKARPEIAKLYEEMATKQAEQIETLRERINRQDTRIKNQDQKIEQKGRKIEKQGATIIKLRQCLREWEEGIRKLVEQITQKGMTPIWTPKSLDDEMAVYEIEEGEKK